MNWNKRLIDVLEKTKEYDMKIMSEALGTNKQSLDYEERLCKYQLKNNWQKVSERF